MMGLFTCQSNRMEHLIDPFIEITSKSHQPLPHPETVLLQSIGMGRYFITHAAEKTGVYANFSFLYPQSFFSQLCALYDLNCHGIDSNTHAWKIFNIARKTPDLFGSSIARYTRNADELKLFKLALSIADTFDQYTMYRRDMILEWDKQNPIAVQNGRMKRLEEKDMWQYELYHAVRDESLPHRADILTRLLHAIEKGGETPFPRITALGLSNLPAFYMQMLVTLSQFTDIYLLLLNPSPEYWFDIVSHKKLLHEETIREYNAGKNSDHYYYMGNPLLSLLGTQGREFYVLLEENNAHPFGEHPYDPPSRDTLLGALHHDMYHLIDRSEFSPEREEPFVFHDTDRSFMIHGCHNRTRELEIVHDQLMDLFNNDETLKPGDILIMTPNIADYEPYISAVFGTRTAGDSPLPYTIADLSLSNTSMSAEVFLNILSLEQERLTFSAVSSILECDDICKSFDIPPGERDKLLDDLYNSSFRWGVDADDRVQQTGVCFDSASLSHAQMRLCAGIAYEPGTDVYEGVSPSVNLESGNLAGIGALFSFLDHLVSFIHLFRKPHTLDEWYCILRRCADTFFQSDDPAPAGIKDIHESLEILKTQAGSVEQVSFPVVRHLVERYLSAEKREFGFIDGRITFCEMLPMRSIPFRVIIMTGMNDGEFPRYTTPLSYDLIHEYPRRGDRSHQNDDRYLFLETILSARDFLIITYIAFNEKDNSQRNYSPVVAELVDYISDNCSCASVVGKIHILHRLQPFTPLYYGTSADYFSYASEYLAGAKAVRHSRHLYTAFSGTVKQAIEPELLTIPVSTLCYFFNNPFRFFLQNRSDVSFPHESTIGDDDETLHVDAFDERTILLSALHGLLDKTMQKKSRKSLEEEGMLPPLYPGIYEYSRIQKRAQAYAARIIQWYRKPESTLHLTHTFISENQKFILSTDLGQSVDDEYHLIESTWTPHKELSNWLSHLFINSCGYQLTARIFTEDRMYLFSPIPREDAVARFQEIISLYHAGLHAPLPFFKDASLKACVMAEREPNVPHEEIALRVRDNVLDGYKILHELKNEYLLFCEHDVSRLFTADFVNCACTVYRGLKEVLSHEKYS